MCGIAGFLATGAGRPGPELLAAMGNTMAHRGPDGSGEWLSPDGRAGLAHRRLAILDLSEGGAQPMVSDDRRFAISFNGEVFNYREIREELKGRGHAFRSDSDTEVMLAACREWGVEGAVSRFIGMFAFALWDDRERKLSLVRDRLGIKPLFLARAPGLVLFASELKGIMACPAFSREVDRAALQHYLSFQYVPAPLAIFRDAEKVLPGHIVAIGADGSRSDRRYWSLAECWEPAAGARRSETDLFDELKGLLASSIRYRMISDVPLGAFLSGGVDSSLVVALMQREAAVPVKTFSIGFSEPGYDESGYARAVAAHLGTEHHEKICTAAEALALVRKAGLSVELFSRAMKSNASNSTTVEMKVPMMIAGDFEPHFSVKHMLKDVRIGMKLAEEYGLELPVTAASRDMLLDEAKHGRGDADYSSVAQKYFPAPAKVVRPEPARMVAPPGPAESEATIAPPKPKPPEPKTAETPAETHAPSKVPVLIAAAKPVESAPEMKESPPIAVEPVRGVKPPRMNWMDDDDDDDDEQEEVPAGVNLSGGIRGWLSRRLSRRKS